MANTIAHFQNYIDRLDRVYAAEAKTAILDSSETLVDLTNAGEFKVPKLSMDGLADYDRKDGYKVGSVNLEFETKKPDYDRARKFRIDQMDNEETAGVAFGTLASEFIRTKVVPELDAFRFAKMATNAGETKTGNLTTGEEVLKTLNSVSASMSEKEVPEEGRILFITPTLFSLADSVDNNKNKAIFDQFSQIVKVPQSRFYSKIDLKEGKSDAGGFVKNSGGADIKFMIVSKSAIIQATKLRVTKIIEPAINQDGDFWDFFYRTYGISDVYDNRKNGIYLHTA